MGLKVELLRDLYCDFREFTKFNPEKKVLTRESSKEGIIKRVVFHCTDASNWTPEKLSDFFVSERRFPCCSYHYYVVSNQIYHMVGENNITYHAAGHNSDSVAFSIDYNPTRDDKLNIAVDPRVYTNAIKIATFLLLKFKLTPDKLFGHRELFGTGFFKDQNDSIVLRKVCPGMKINLDQFRYSVSRLMQETINKIFNEGENLVVDGIFGPASKKALSKLSFSEQDYKPFDIVGAI